MVTPGSRFSLWVLEHDDRMIGDDLAPGRNAQRGAPAFVERTGGALLALRGTWRPAWKNRVVHVSGESRDVPDRFGAARWRFDVRSREAADAVRGAFLETLRRDGYPAQQRAVAEIVLGELLGNAVRYAAGTVDLTIEWESGHPIVHLLDRGPGFTFVAALPKDPFSERGRGLYLVHALAHEFHVTRRPDGGSHARVVLRLP